MSLTIGGGRRISLEEVAKVATSKQKVVLDEATLQKIVEIVRDNKKPKTSIEADFIDKSFMDNAFPVHVVRAGILCRLVSLMQGNTKVGTEAINLLTEALNLEITPLLSTANTGTTLAAFLSGHGFCVADGGQMKTTSDAFAAAGLTGIELSEEEVNACVAYPFIEIGTGCLLAYAAQNTIKCVDAVTSLSCEVIGVNSTAFDSANFETNRPHRGQMLSASNLKLLLEGSKCVNKEACPLEQAVQFRGLPQITGPCQETIAVAAKAMDIELNSCESVSATDASIVYNASQAIMAIKNIVAALSVLADASKERTSILESVAKIESPVKAESVDVTLATGAADAMTLNQSYGFADKLTRQLASETFTALTFFSNADAAAELATKMSEASIDPSAAAAKNAGADKAKKETDDPNWTPAQRAAAEKKRKEKEEKAAAKAAAKAAKKGSSGLVLGAGSAQIRSYFTAHAKSSAANAVTLDSVTACLYPIDTTEDSLANNCVKVLEQLNSSGTKRKPKIPKGTRDYFPEQMRIREQAFLAIRRVFKRHGGVEIDTPVFELKEVLTGKYGEDSKLIYDLADQGGELLSLRYDLTVPFARFLAMSTYGNIKRYHMAKVYRRDQPQLARGRYREFYQCDFDIAGSYSSMVPDAEVISVAAEILSELPVGQFLIKLNHRKLLDAIFDICGVPMEKFRPICSAIDKLDKAPWSEVKAEMVDEKGLSEAVADKIGTFVLNTGKPKELWAELTEKSTFGDHKEANVAMSELKLLFTYLEAMGSLEYVSFDLSLARGLDYYTGVIYEAVLVDGTSQVGSIAAGGRYDNLVGMFSPAGVQTPCVGVSIGIERVFTIMEKKAEELKINQASNIQVYIASIGSNLLPERMKIANLLWKANISAEYSHLEKPVFKKQLDDTLEKGIPFMVVLGSDELKNGLVKIKNMVAHTEVEVPYNEVVQQLIAAGVLPLSSASDLSFIDAMKKAEA